LEDPSRQLDKVEQLLTILDELRFPKKGMLRNTLRFFKVPAVGSLNQLRAELQMRFAGHQLWVRTKSGHTLDAMFIPCAGSQGVAESEAAHERVPLGAGMPPAFSGPVLVWCSPNAAYYETMVYQSNWLNFWLGRGVSLFLFNYSGYGRSSGTPSPPCIAEDGESIIRFLKSKGVTQIAVYGRSIGGVAACHLARQHPDVVCLLVADRTMSTLESAARCMYGTWAAKGLKLTNMVHENTDNFWESRCYKLLVCDPKDTMILDLAALRTAVALRALERTPPHERLALPDETLLALFEVWAFFDRLLDADLLLPVSQPSSEASPSPFSSSGLSFTVGWSKGQSSRSQLAPSQHGFTCAPRENRGSGDLDEELERVVELLRDGVPRAGSL